MVRGLFAERRIIDAAHRSCEPDPALAVEHAVVIVGSLAPDFLVAPVRGSADGFGHGIGVQRRSERFRHIRIATGHFKNVTLCAFGSRIGMSSDEYSFEPYSGP